MKETQKPIKPNAWVQWSIPKPIDIKGEYTWIRFRRKVKQQD
jgi:hypothetical protein